MNSMVKSLGSCLYRINRKRQHAGSSAVLGEDLGAAVCGDIQLEMVIQRFPVIGCMKKHFQAIVSRMQLKCIQVQVRSISNRRETHPPARYTSL